MEQKIVWGGQADSIDELFVNENRTVIKAVHESGCETAIKFSEMQRQAINPLSGQMEQFCSQRNKYALFASSSVGCFMKCAFCHLTIKGMKHRRLTEEALLENLKDSLRKASVVHPEMSSMFIKLSWMGMGEAIARPDVMRRLTIQLLDWAHTEGLAVGLDGVDLGTVMPSGAFEWETDFTKLNQELERFNKNPANTSLDNNGGATFDRYQKRSPFRVFWSLHSVNEATRALLVPGAQNPIDAAQRLAAWSATSGGNVIVHHLALDGVNDSLEESTQIAEFCLKYLPNSEFRLLRYNHCTKTTERESERFAKIAQFFSERLERVKVQISPGKEVQAACGQFIVKSFERDKDPLMETQ